MRTMSIAERRGATRDLIARAIVSLLVLLACAVVLIAVLKPEAVTVAERVYLAVVGLAVIVARYYFQAR